MSTSFLRRVGAILLVLLGVAAILLAGDLWYIVATEGYPPSEAMGPILFSILMLVGGIALVWGATRVWKGHTQTPVPTSLSAPRDGWYLDPTCRHEMRYFDGTTWTEHVADRGLSGTDPMSG